MKHIPMYKRMQGVARREAEAKVYEAYRQYSVVEGTPGSVTEDSIRGKLSAIVSSGQSRDNKLELLDALHWYTVNNVEHGAVSDVLEEIDRASEKVLYEVKR